MTDVHELLARTQRAIGGAEAPLEPAAHDHLLAGIRRRRRRRHVGEALGTTAVVVVVGTVAWFGLGRGTAPQPADTPAPTPSASAAPTVTPTPTPVVELVPAPDAAGLPPASVLPEGVLEAAAPGWVLTTQWPTYLSDQLEGTATAHVLDLVSPDGERYRVLDLPLDLRIDLARWTAGELEALVVVGPDGEGAAVAGPARLDLRTGELAALAGLPEFSRYLARTPDGADLWDGGDSRVLVHDGSDVVRVLGVVGDPVVDGTGTRVAGRDDDLRPVVVDVATGEVTAVPAGTECWPGAWRGADLLLSCMSDPDEYPVPERLVRWDADAGGDVVEVDVTGVDSLPPGGGAEVADGRVATMYSPYAECSDGWGLLDVDSGVLTPGPRDAEEDYFLLRASGQSVYVQAMTICRGDAWPTRLLRHDVVTGGTVELASAPDHGEVPDGGQRWMLGMSSWTVGD